MQFRSSTGLFVLHLNWGYIPNRPTLKFDNYQLQFQIFSRYFADIFSVIRPWSVLDRKYWKVWTLGRLAGPIKMITEEPEMWWDARHSYCSARCATAVTQVKYNWNFRNRLINTFLRRMSTRIESSTSCRL